MIFLFQILTFLFNFIFNKSYLNKLLFQISLSFLRSQSVFFIIINSLFKLNCSHFETPIMFMHFRNLFYMLFTNLFKFFYLISNFIFIFF
jgi:hypothetical protein